MLTRVQLVHGGPQDGDADHPPGAGRERLPVRLGERAGDRPRAQRARAEGQLRGTAAPGRQHACAVCRGDFMMSMLRLNAAMYL